jgi:uncharacterized OB-fold protein
MFAARDVAVFTASGKGRLCSSVIHRRPMPGFTPPYSIAVVELEEGPRTMTNITQCPQTPEALQLDMPVEGSALSSFVMAGLVQTCSGHSRRPARSLRLARGCPRN